MKLSREDSSPLMDEGKYIRLVGSLIYLCNTRLDTSFATGVLSKFSNKPWKNHWNVGMWVQKYIKGTLQYGITYTMSRTLIGFCDSKWAGDMDSRKSITYYCFSLGSRVVSWVSKKQPTVALSSTEADYKSACFASCEAMWLRRIFGDLGIAQSKPTHLSCDNQSCMAIAKNLVFHARTKHIEIQYHFVQLKTTLRTSS